MTEILSNTNADTVGTAKVLPVLSSELKAKRFLKICILRTYVYIRFYTISAALQKSCTLKCRPNYPYRYPCQITVT